MLDQPASENRADGGRHRGEARPRADGAASFLFRKRRTDNRQAPGNKKGGGDALDGPRKNQLIDTLGETTCSGRETKERDTAKKNATAAEQVSS